MSSAATAALGWTRSANRHNHFIHRRSGQSRSQGPRERIAERPGHRLGRQGPARPARSAPPRRDRRQHGEEGEEDPARRRAYAAALQARFERLGAGRCYQRSGDSSLLPGPVTSYARVMMCFKRSVFFASSISSAFTAASSSLGGQAFDRRRPRLSPSTASSPSAARCRPPRRARWRLGAVDAQACCVRSPRAGARDQILATESGLRRPRRRRGRSLAACRTAAYVSARVVSPAARRCVCTRGPPPAAHRGARRRSATIPPARPSMRAISRRCRGSCGHRRRPGSGRVWKSACRPLRRPPPLPLDRCAHLRRSGGGGDGPKRRAPATRRQPAPGVGRRAPRRGSRARLDRPGRQAWSATADPTAPRRPHPYFLTRNHCLTAPPTPWGRGPGSTSRRPAAGPAPTLASVPRSERTTLTRPCARTTRADDRGRGPCRAPLLGRLDGGSRARRHGLGSIHHPRGTTADQIRRRGARTRSAAEPTGPPENRLDDGPNRAGSRAPASSRRHAPAYGQLHCGPRPRQETNTPSATSPQPSRDRPRPERFRPRDSWRRRQLRDARRAAPGKAKKLIVRARPDWYASMSPRQDPDVTLTCPALGQHRRSLSAAAARRDRRLSGPGTRERLT